MLFWPVNTKIWVAGTSPDRPNPSGGAELLDFLDAGDEFSRLFSMLFRDSGGGERQNDYDFLRCEYVNTPVNCGAVDLAGPALAVMRHAIVFVRGALIRSLDVLDCLAQFLVQVLYRHIESVLIRDPKDHLQTVVRGRDSYNFTVRFCLPAFGKFKLNAGFFVAKVTILLSR